MDQITTALFLKLLRLLVGILSFIGLLSLDVWKAWKTKATWVPAGALVLSAFSLQLLDLLNIDNVSISDNADTRRWDLEIVLRNGLLIDGRRVFVCVYMGYSLPEMARARSTSVVWYDIGALALSELYVFMEFLYPGGEGFKPSQDNIAPSPSYIEPSPRYLAVNPVSGLCGVYIGFCAVLLFLLLGSAAFAGKTLYNLVAEKIPLALGEKPALYTSVSVEQDVFRSWIVAWVCKPDYIITRSVLPSSVALAVTVPVLCFASEWVTQDYKVRIMMLIDKDKLRRFLKTGHATFFVYEMQHGYEWRRNMEDIKAFEKSLNKMNQEVRKNKNTKKEVMAMLR